MPNVFSSIQLQNISPQIYLLYVPKQFRLELAIFSYSDETSEQSKKYSQYRYLNSVENTTFQLNYKSWTKHRIANSVAEQIVRRDRRYACRDNDVLRKEHDRTIIEKQSHSRIYVLQFTVTVTCFELCISILSNLLRRNGVKRMLGQSKERSRVDEVSLVDCVNACGSKGNTGERNFPNDGAWY